MKMKIKMSKSQWEFIKCSQSNFEIDFLKTLPQDIYKGIQSLPNPIKQDLIKQIKIYKNQQPNEKEMENAIREALKSIQKNLQIVTKITDRTPAPTVDKIKEIIELVKINNPSDPILKYLEDLQQYTAEIDQITSQEDKIGIQNAINSILDRFKQGKITKKQMEQSLKEFSKNNINKIVLS
jgi:hypothetical protein